MERHGAEGVVRDCFKVVVLVVLAGCPRPEPEEPPKPPPVRTPVETPVAVEPECLGRPELIEIGDSSVHGLSAGDLSGDGVVDLAVLQDEMRGANFVTVLTVYLGDGKGGFRAGDKADVGSLVVATQLADLDRDGQLDVVLAQYREKKVAVLRGTGGGGLAKAKTFATPRKPTHVAVADLDGDGDLDLLVSSQTHLQAHLGDGKGTFKAQKAFAVGQAPDWPVVTDLDRDGLPDLYIPMNDDSKFHVYRGTGKGAFKPLLVAESCASPSFPRTGDLDGDGVVDVAYNCVATQTPSVEIRLGRGTDVDTVQVDSVPTEHLELGDFTGDGKLDLVTMGQMEAFAETHLRLHPGNGDGTFDEPLHATIDSELNDPVSADLNGDGRLDLVAAYWTGRAPAALAVFTDLVTSSDCL